MNLGAHMSMAGGLHLACERGRAVGANVIQIFTKNERQWAAKPLTDEDIRLFREAQKREKIHTIFAHDTYLHNLATAKEDLRKKSIDGFVAELERCESLGLLCLVSHPGSPGEAGEAAGLINMSRSLDEVLKRTRGFKTLIALETSAGQGACVGWRFEHMKAIRDGVKEPERIKFCFDTCHTFAAGYDLRTQTGYDSVMEEFDRLLGLENIAAFHLNDSKKDLGCRVDRHENIGQGCIGTEAFRCLLNDPRLEAVPKVLETPKENDMDPVNLKLLRSLIGKKPRAGRKTTSAR